ncbi:MAG: RsmE family RNA methyltransferase [Candidatus Omnitrophota bacterium]
MNRFYVPEENIRQDQIFILRPDDIRHVRKVLRIRPGEELLVTDGEGSSYIAFLERADADACVLKVRSRLEKKTREDSKIRLALAVAVPKNTSFEEVIDKGTQLGVDEFIPLVTQRSSVSLEQIQRKMPRYRRVLEAAACQSGVLFLPFLREPMGFEDFLDVSSCYSLRLLPNLFLQTQTFQDVLKNFSGCRVAACVGPEGDFTEDEVRLAMARGFQGLNLGDSVLRVDTAAISIAAALRIFLV